ncbi:MAG TPA: transposase [Polyangiaceae bacterium]|nr:transposase [Polyangiaceae bacterium]
MASPTRFKEIPNYWNISDERWAAICALLAAHDPPYAAGRRRVDQRAALDAIIYLARTHCRWNKLPPHLPDDSAVNRTYRRWVKLGLFPQIWQIVVAPGDDAPASAEAPGPDVEVPEAPASTVRVVAATGADARLEGRVGVGPSRRCDERRRA